MNILLIGASSAIATAVARRYAAHQSGLFLIARDGSRLATQKEDLKIRGAARVGTHELDLLINEEHEAAIKFKSVPEVVKILNQHKPGCIIPTK